MPNYYAHLRFGNRVLEGLSECVRLRIQDEYDAFVLGQYGPDPLYFCKSKSARAWGKRIHHRPVSEMMERLRVAVEQGVPNSAGYAAGFLCHFALDSCCHGYLRQRAGAGGLRHVEIEAEFDRFLMERDGVDFLSQTPMPIPRMPASFDRFLEESVYPGVKGSSFRSGMELYRKCNLWHTRTARSVWANQTLGRIMVREEHLYSMIFKKESVIYKRDCEELLQLLENEAREAGGKIDSFLGAAPLDEWYDRDFFQGSG